MADPKQMQVDFDDDEDDEAELQALKAKQAEMEKNAQQLQAALSGQSFESSTPTDSKPPPKEGTDGGEVEANGESAAPATEEEREEVDSRSIYIGNVDYGATPEEIQKHFQACGTINRVTILCDKFTGHPKGYAYVEFSSPDLVKNALVLNESMFRGRVLQVTAKRTNKPGFGARGRGRGRGGYRGGYVRGGGGYSPYRARGRGRGRGL